MNIEKRRRVRVLEAKRDKLLMTSQKTKKELAKVRTELRSERATR